MIPYTYLVGWTEYNKWYYGVRYAKNCHPSDLWKPYKTSSKYVKRFYNKHGDPDVIQIRKTFLSAKDAIDWEQKVLRRLDVEKNSKFLNTKNATTKTIIIKPNSGSFKKGLTPWNKDKHYDEMTIEERKEKFGRIFSEDDKQHLRELSKERFANNELRDIVRERTIAQFNDPEKKKRHKESCKGHIGKGWINNGVINKRATKEEFEQLKDFGWSKGRLILSENKFYNHGNRKRSSETGQYI